MYVSKAFGRYCGHLGLSDPGLVFHTLRNTFMEVMEAEGVPESTVKLLVGHKRKSITYGGYSKGARLDLRAAISKLVFRDDISALVRASDLEAMRMRPTSATIPKKKPIGVDSAVYTPARITTRMSDMAFGLLRKLQDANRLRRVRTHIARHGDTFVFHGREVTLSHVAGFRTQNSVLRGRYETSEAKMILKHLPRSTPVIELGGSCGLVSNLINSRLLPGTKHIVVEADPRLIPMCEANARAEIVCAAIDYRGPTARFQVGQNVHMGSISLRDSGEHGDIIEVPTVTLGELHERAGSPSAFTLVSDIEGAEFMVFERDQASLRHVSLAIIETHPWAYERFGGSLAKFEELYTSAGLKRLDQCQDVVVLAR